MSEEPQKKYRCGDCGKAWSENDKVCSNCGSSRKCTPVFAYGYATIRTGFHGKSKDKAGKRKPSREFKSASKIGANGKEAREYYDADRENDNWIHIVEEKDDNSDWKVVHREAEPLKEHRKTEFVKKAEKP